MYHESCSMLVSERAIHNIKKDRKQGLLKACIIEKVLLKIHTVDCWREEFLSNGILKLLLILDHPLGNENKGKFSELFPSEGQRERKVGGGGGKGSGAGGGTGHKRNSPGGGVA